MKRKVGVTSTPSFDAAASLRRDKGLALTVALSGVQDSQNIIPTYGLGYLKAGEFHLEANVKPYAGYSDFSGMTLGVGFGFYFGMFGLGGQYSRVSCPIAGTVAVTSYSGLFGVKQKNLGIQVAYTASDVSGTQGIFGFSGFVDF